MKLKFLFLGLVASAVLYSCGGNEEKKAEQTTDSTAAEVNYIVDTANSSITWKGEMLKLYAHHGLLKLKEGNITVKGTQVTGGTFTADMQTISPKDSNFSKDRPKENLIGHLSSKDFFAIDSFPTAAFTIKKIEGNTITGDLTVRGRTNEEKVTDVMVDTTGGKITATGKLIFDRQKYGVSFKIPVQDKVLSDNIVLDVKLTGNKK